MQDSGSTDAVQRNVFGQDLLSSRTGSTIATVLWVALALGCVIGLTLIQDASSTIITAVLVLLALSILSRGWEWWSVRTERRVKFGSTLTS